jgi:hypothetical protein
MAGGLVSISIVTCRHRLVLVYALLPEQTKTAAGRAVYRFVNAVEVNTYWPIIYECYVHHSSKDAVLHAVLPVKLSDLAEEGVVQLFAFRWRGGLVEVELVLLGRS